MAKVALVRCESYDYGTVLQAVGRGLALIGGPGQFAAPGEKILLKPNLLAADPPEKCTTTHFAVFKAVAEVFQRTGARLSYGDSPGFGSPLGAAKKSGIAGAADDERHAGALTSMCAHDMLGLMSDNWLALRAMRGQWAGKVPHA